MLTPRAVLTRESESLRTRFRGAEGTLRVPIEPCLLSLESESRGGRLDPTQSAAEKAEKRKRREENLSAFSVNWSVVSLRRKETSSPEVTLFETMRACFRAADLTQAAFASSVPVFRVPFGGRRTRKTLFEHAINRLTARQCKKRLRGVLRRRGQRLRVTQPAPHELRKAPSLRTCPPRPL